MNRAVWLFASLVLLVSWGCQRNAAPPVVPAGDAEPSLRFKDHNLVFVSFDALQAAHIGALGYPRDITPTIDALARQSYNFTRVSSVASWTVPASMTWFTGVYPSEHRMVNKYTQFNQKIQKPANLKELSPHLFTLADLLKKRGYRTAGFTGNAGVSGGFGFEQGFDVYVHDKGRFGSMDQSVPRALDWLRKHRDEKFFLFLHGYDVHGQCSPPEGYDYRFVDKDYDKRFTGSELEQEILREEGLDRGQLTLRDADVRFWRAIYDEKINRVDARFKHFLTEYGRLGLADNTLFVVTSDHGTELYEHRRFDHGFTLYDELLHVPLFVKVPGHTKGRSIVDRVSSIDVMPTILDLMDVSLSTTERKQLRGVSLRAAMRGESVARDLFAETDYREYTYKRAIITPDGWKFIYTLERHSCELYNLEKDPGETDNRANAESALAKELERRLFAHFRSIGHDLTQRRWEIGLNPVYPSQGKKR